MKKVKKMKKMVKSMMMIEKLTNVKTKRSVTSSAKDTGMKKVK
jgi:hypothetical protein